MTQATETRRGSDSGLIVGNSLVLLVRRSVLFGLNGVLILFLPRYLGDEGLGQLAFAQSLGGMFATAMSLGVSQYLIKSIARDHSMVQRLLAPAIGMRLMTAVVVYAAIVGVAQVTDQTDTARKVIYIMGGTAIALSFVHLTTGVIHGLENMVWPAVAEVASKLIVISVGIFVLVKGLGVAPYAAVLLAAALTYLGLCTVYLARRYPLRVSFDMSAIKPLVIGGLPFLAMGVLLDIYNQIDMVILRLFTSDAVVGWYAAATHMYRTLEMVPLVLTTALLPTLSRVHAGGAQQAIAIAKKSIAAGALVTLPVALGISLLSAEVIEMLPYPDAFTNTVPLLTILALTIPVTAFLTILGTIAVAVDRQKAWAVALAATLMFNVVGNVLAAPYFQEHYGNGGIGVALTTFVSEALMVAIGIRMMPRGVIDSTLMMSLLRVALCGGVMVLAGLVMKGLDLGIAPVVVVGAATYISMVFATRAVTGDDIRFLKQVVRQRLGKSDDADDR